MKTLDLQHKLANVYLLLLRNLQVEVQLDFIAKLSTSLKYPKQEKKTVAYYSGIWQSDESAEDIIADIRNARTFNRKIETF